MRVGKTLIKNAIRSVENNLRIKISAKERALDFAAKLSKPQISHLSISPDISYANSVLCQANLRLGYKDHEYRIVTKPRHLTAEELIGEIKRLSSEGKGLREREVVKYDTSLRYFARIHFGSWWKALDVAGIDRIKLHETALKWPGDRIIEEIQRLHNEGALLTMRHVDEQAPGLPSAARLRFGGWKKAIEAAGFDYGSVKHRIYSCKWSPESVVEEIKRLYAEGKPLNSTDAIINYDDLFSAARRYNGSWQKAIESAGIDYYAVWKYRWNASKVIQEIRKLHEEGEPLSSGAASIDHSDLHNAAYRQFGCWRKALEAADVDYNEVHETALKWPATRVIAEIQKLKKEGSPLTTTVANEKVPGLTGAAYNRFGGWKKAVKAAGKDTILK